MKIAIIGTVGLPSNYGGFETLVENLTKFLGQKTKIVVFCSSRAYKEKMKEYNNARLKYIPLNANGIQSIFYDILSLLRSVRKHDTILILGVSGCIILPFFRLLFPSKKLIINIDGLEHQREKWKMPIRRFLKYSERLAVKFGDIVVADNKAIQDYVKAEYNKDSAMIAYGGDHAERKNLTAGVKQKYSLPDEYAFKVCRIEPENNIHLILEAFSSSSLPLVIIGNWNRSDYGKNLKQKYAACKNLYLLEPIYDSSVLNQIRSNCLIYIHGHSAGGTNPSLVEAMHLGLPVFAFDVKYNRETTFNQAVYFKSIGELENLVATQSKSQLKELALKMEIIAQREYTWEKIAFQYFELFSELTPAVVQLSNTRKTMSS